MTHARPGPGQRRALCRSFCYSCPLYRVRAQTMNNDKKLAEDLAPYTRAFEEAWEELNRERPGKFSEYDWNDRIIEKGFNPYTGEPLADIEAFQQEEREKDGRRLISLMEINESLIKTLAEEMQGGEDVDQENTRGLHDDYVAELADMQEELAALNLSPDYVRAVTVTVREIAEEARRAENYGGLLEPFNARGIRILRKQNRQTFGTLEQAHQQIGDALGVLTQLYNFVLHELKTTPRSKAGKHIKKLVEDAGRRLLFARDSIAEAGKTKQP